MSEESINLLVSILFFIFAAFIAYYMWFRDGAKKSQMSVLKFFDENAPGSVSKFDRIVNHPFIFKAGSILLILASIVAIYSSFASLN